MNRFNRVKKIFSAMMAAVMVLCLTVSCDGAPAQAKYDLSQAEGVCYHYSDFSVYVTDEDIAVVEDTLNQVSLCLSVE